MENEFVEHTRQNPEPEAPKSTSRPKNNAARSVKKPNAFVQILNGDFLNKEFIVNNLPFIFFLMLLLILSVGKGYYGKQLSTSVNEAQSELDELTGGYFDTKARLEENTQRAKLIERLENTGLKETTNPTKVIRIRKEENDK